MIKISYSELIHLLSITPANQSILITGKHGIGKSEIITGFYSIRGYEVVTLFLGQMSDAGDLLGLPKEKVVDNNGVRSSVMNFLPPFWWQHSKPFLLFLDEINRARPEILQVIFDLVLNRKLGGRSLPTGSMVISACNYGDQYQLTELDPALVSRFNIYELDPTLDDWISWATEYGIDDRVILFHKEIQGMLDPVLDNNDDVFEKTPDRRAWVRVSDIIKNKKSELSNTDYKIIAGIIGAAATSNFKKFVESRRSISAEQLLLSNYYETVSPIIQKLEVDEMIFLNEQIRLFLLKTAEKNFTELEMNLIYKNLMLYFQTIKKLKKDEILSEFFSLILLSDKLKSLIFENQELTEFISSFISKTRIK